MKLSSRFFDVYISHPKAGEPVRRETSVGTKVFKKAVDRNKLKRRIKEVLALSNNLIRNSNVRVIALKDSCLLNFREIKEDLSNIFKKL